jgi:hypothetical protein
MYLKISVIINKDIQLIKVNESLVNLFDPLKIELCNIHNGTSFYSHTLHPSLARKIKFFNHISTLYKAKLNKSAATLCWINLLDDEY